MNITEATAKKFFTETMGEEITSWTKLPQSGSSRINYVCERKNEKYVITYNEDIRENNSFLYFSEVFEKLNLNTPKIFHISNDRKIYIQEYLGEKTLSQIIEKEGESERTTKLVQKSLEALFKMQVSTKNKLDFSKAFDYELYNELPILHDLYYFKSFLVDVLEVNYHKSTLLKEFKNIVSKIESLEPKGMMIRDFQSRNIMVNEYDEVFFIDYQSAMEGPLLYDVVSFLYQAKAHFSEDFKQEMLNYYIQKFDDQITQNQLQDAIPYMKLMRFLQVLGAYGFRGLIQRKKHFLESLEQGIKNIDSLSETWTEMQNYPELKRIIEGLNLKETKITINQIIDN